MSGRKRATLSPSLFPFLAVLVCTLGTLILLLALVAQNAVDATVTQREHQAQPTSNIATSNPDADHPGLTALNVSSMIEDQKFMIDQYISFREEQTGEIEERRDKIAHVEAHIAKVRQEIARLNQEVESATSEDASRELSQADVEELKRTIAAKEQELEEQRSTKKSGNPRVVIVPHKGPNGTDRRPVYLECTHRGVLIWPEKSFISIDRLANASRGANPIESALRVIRNHAMTTYGDPIPPYPLLVVRPDGVQAYIAARSAMTEYDDQFGYELVPEHVQLALPKSDRELKTKVERAIADAISKQNYHSVIAGRNNFQRKQRLPVLSAAAMDREGRSSGFSSRPQDQRRPYSMGPTNSSLDSVRSYADQNAQNRSRSMNAGNSDGLGRSSSGQAAVTQTWDSSPHPGIDPAKVQQWNNELETAASELKGQGSSLDDAAGMSPEQMFDASMVDKSSANDSVNEWSGAESPSGSFGSAQSDPGSSKSTREESKRESNEAVASEQSNRSSTGNTDEIANASSSQHPDAPPVSRSGQSSTSSASGASQPNSSPPPMLDPSSERWVLPPNVSLGSGNAIVRRLKADFYADGFVLRSSRQSPTESRFPIDRSDPTQAMMDLATSIHDQIKRWGVALPGGHWSPQLEVTVHPDGEFAFQQFKQLMRSSGVEVIAAVPSGQFEQASSPSTPTKR